MTPDLRGGVSASDRERPLVTGVNGPLMAWRPSARLAGSFVPCSTPSSSIAAVPRAVTAVSGLAKRPRGALGLDAADPAETIEQRGGP